MRYRKLKFKPEYLRLLKEGRKKTTIRLEKKYRVGETVYLADTNGRIYGKAVIEDIVEKKLGELTNSDALVDGFENLAELLTILREIYGEVGRDRILYIYHIKVLNWSRNPP